MALSANRFEPLLRLFTILSQAHAAIKEVYSQDLFCSENACVNPLFPGLNDMPRLEQIPWQCGAHSQIKNYLDFCSGAIEYDSALPSPNGTAFPLSDLVKAQDDAAATMFFYHMSGIGYEAWESTQKPSESSDDCIRSAWRLVCFTYFPKADAGCQPGQPDQYRRPCASSCARYVHSCGVECCDESIACSFSHEVEVSGGYYDQTGYVDASGPSAICTGAANRLASWNPLLLLVAVFAASFGLELPSFSWRRIGLPLLVTALAVGLQGCGVPKHDTGNWRVHNDYLLSMEYIPPGGNQLKAALNTCLKPPGEVLQCSGHGWCEQRSARPNSIAFCKCERDWADPECRTRRKSQTTAFLLSLFLGFFGADRYYLGYPATAFCKLLTSSSLQMAASSTGSSGGVLTSCACFWWLFDIVRTGSGAVYAAKYRVAADLPHLVFMMAVVFVFLMGGVVVGVESYAAQRNKKRANQMASHDQEEAFASEKQREYDGLKFRVQRPGGEPCNFEQRGFGGYGAMLLQKPMYQSNSGQSYAQDDFYYGQSTPGTLAPPEAPRQLGPVMLPAVVAEQGGPDPSLWEDEDAGAPFSQAVGSI